MQSALRDDALSTEGDGVVVRVGLPWIRSLPIACVSAFAVEIDGEPVTDIRVRIGERIVASAELVDESGWWHLQDRLALIGTLPVGPGEHSVTVSFTAMIPYLLAGPGGGALTIPLKVARHLQLDHPLVPSVSRDVA